MNTLYNRQIFTAFFACLLAVSMMVSPFLLSVSMWGLVAAAFWECAVTMPESQAAGTLSRAFNILKYSFQRLFHRPELAFFSLLLLVPAFSFFWSADTEYWLERTRIRLPFLVLPWAFANLPALTPRQTRLVMYVVVWALTLICIGAATHFFLHAADVVTGIGRGIPVPVPRSHIRFSLILATGIMMGGWLWYEGFYWRYAWERYLLGVMLVFLFFFIHLLSVRSGLLGLYATLIFTLGRYVWRTKRWGIGLVTLVILGLGPFIAMQTMPSFRTRVHYMIWDWQQYRQNAGNTYSDAERIISWRAGWQLWQENPLLGVGAGDLPAEVKRVVDERFPSYNDAPKLPHNQFLYILASTGLAGLLLSLIAFSAPLWPGRYRRFYLFAVFQILVFASFLVEYTIETAMGVSFYLFYTLWFMRIGGDLYDLLFKKTTPRAGKKPG